MSLGLKKLSFSIIAIAAVAIIAYLYAIGFNGSQSDPNHAPFGEATIAVNSTDKIPILLFKTVGQREVHLIGTATISMAKPESNPKYYL